MKISTRVPLQMYIRLLTYGQAMKFIEWFGESYDGKRYSFANITAGGVSVQLYKDEFPKCADYLDAMGWRYEWGMIHPTLTVSKIVDDLKNKCVIE